MGTGFRVFFVDENETIRCIPFKRFERLMGSRTNECLIQYADQRVRYALATLETENRRPASISYISYGILPFDAEGYIGKNEIEKEMFLAINSVSDNLPTQSEAENVVDATAVFAGKRYSNEFKWIPSPEIEKAIADMIFKKPHR